MFTDALQRVAAHVRDIVGYNTDETVDCHAPLSSFAFDSLDILDFTQRLECEFNLHPLDFAEIQKLLNLHDVARYLVTLQADKFEEVSMEKRIRKTDDHLVIKSGDKSEEIPLKSLESWGGWSRVEHAVKSVVRNKEAALTRDEFEVIESCAVGRGGKSGYAEFAQAYRQYVAAW